MFTAHHVASSTHVPHQRPVIIVVTMAANDKAAVGSHPKDDKFIFIIINSSHGHGEFSCANFCYFCGVSDVAFDAWCDILDMCFTTLERTLLYFYLAANFDLT